MPRPIRHKLDFTPESLRTQLERLHNQAEDLRVSAMRDYREIKQLTNSGDAGARAANTVNLETARNNALRTAREAIAQSTDLLKIQAGVMVAQAKAEAAAQGEAGENQEALASDARAELRAMARELRKQRDDEHPAA